MDNVHLDDRTREALWRRVSELIEGHLQTVEALPAWCLGARIATLPSWRRLASYGRWPAGPVRLDTRTPDALVSARLGSEVVGRKDVVLGDADGVLFVAAASVEELLGFAREI